MMDKSWMEQPRSSAAYLVGLRHFIEFAFANSQTDRILCPCEKCNNCLRVDRLEAYDHLVCYGFVKSYTCWHFHGEATSSSMDAAHHHVQSERDKCDDIRGLLNDKSGMRNVGVETPNETVEPRVQHNEEAKKFHDLLKDAEQELYPGCKKYSKLSCIVKLLQFKREHELVDEAFNRVLGVIKSFLPRGETLPESFSEMEKFMKDLGIEDKEGHLCSNDASTQAASPNQHERPASTDVKVLSSQDDSNGSKGPMKPIMLKASTGKKKKSRAR